MRINKAKACILLFAFLSIFPSMARPAMDAKDYETVSFNDLGGYEYQFPHHKRAGVGGAKSVPSAIPDNIKSLNGKEVAVKGYVMPFQMDENGIKTFALVRHMASCCFGGSPRINDFIFVTMAGNKKLESWDMTPIMIYGKFEVGERYEDGELAQIYSLTADKYEPAP